MWKEARTLESRKVTGEYPSALSKGSGGAFFITVLWAISWFIKIELKQIYCSNSPNKKIQNGFQSFLLLFLRSVLLLNGKKILVMICLFFISFIFPQLLYCSPALPLFWRAWKEAWVKKKHCYHQSTNFETNFPLSYENAQYHQNRRQEVFNKEFLRLCRGAWHFTI